MSAVEHSRGTSTRVLYTSDYNETGPDILHYSIIARATDGHGFGSKLLA